MKTLLFKVKGGSVHYLYVRPEAVSFFYEDDANHTCIGLIGDETITVQATLDSVIKALGASINKV